MNYDCLGVIISHCDSITRGTFSAVSRAAAALAAPRGVPLSIHAINRCTCHYITAARIYVAVELVDTDNFSTDFRVYANGVIEPSKGRLRHNTTKTSAQDVREFLVSHDITPAEFIQFVRASV